MNLTELQTEVALITNRPDLTSEILSSIKAATLKAHHSDFYSKDIHETGIEFTEAAFRHSWDYINLISNFRALKYFRVVEDENDDIGHFLEIIPPELTLDAYGRNRNDIAYVAGRVLEIRSSTSFRYALVGCYVSPIVATITYSSWVANLYPYVIIHEAARRVFAMIGQPQEANLQAQLFGEELKVMRQDALSDIGY